jgi:hypothetical protein
LETGAKEVIIVGEFSIGHLLRLLFVLAVIVGIRWGIFYWWYKANKN